jgi:hypothetical protein
MPAPPAFDTQAALAKEIEALGGRVQEFVAEGKLDSKASCILLE